METAMDILTATKDFEKWVGGHIPVVKSQFSDKHKQMAESPIQFLRGTFYRWTQLFPEICPELRKAPAVLSVGDLHIASFVWPSAPSWTHQKAKLTSVWTMWST
jgi:hypothetical protein